MMMMNSITNHVAKEAKKVARRPRVQRKQRPREARVLKAARRRGQAPEESCLKMIQAVEVLQARKRQRIALFLH